MSATRRIMVEYTEPGLFGRTKVFSRHDVTEELEPYLADNSRRLYDSKHQPPCTCGAEGTLRTSHSMHCAIIIVIMAEGRARQAEEKAAAAVERIGREVDMWRDEYRDSRDT